MAPSLTPVATGSAANSSCVFRNRPLPSFVPMPLAFFFAALSPVFLPYAHGPTVLQRYIHPHQLAVGTSDGTEAIIHATRATLDDRASNPMVLLQIDASNAFNNIERSVVLAEFILRVPLIARWIHYIYGNAPYLLFGPYRLRSQTDTQGDPLAMLLFAIDLHPLFLELTVRFPALPLHAWYADDGTGRFTRPCLPNSGLPHHPLSAPWISHQLTQDTRLVPFTSSSAFTPPPSSSLLRHQPSCYRRAWFSHRHCECMYRSIATPLRC